MDMIAKLFSQALNQRVPLLNDYLLEKVFETTVNSGYSDLTIGDFESRRRAINHMVTNDFNVDRIAVTGEYSGDDNTFFLSAESIKNITEEFKT